MSGTKKESVLLSIKPDGVVERVVGGEFIEQVAGASVTGKRRASHVYPSDPFLEALFRLVRKIFGDDGPMAQWTRGWNCRWYVDLRPVGGKTMGLFSKRATAIAYEQQWLLDHYK